MTARLRRTIAFAALALLSLLVLAPAAVAQESQEYPGALIHRHPFLPSLPQAGAPTPVAAGFPDRDVHAALLQYFTLLVYENVHYWAVNSFVEDWQYELTWGDQKRKLIDGDGYRFDSNAFSTNWTHAYAGGIYYTTGRANGLTPLESFWLTLGESVYWEGIVEWREVFSLNDTVSTIFGGVSIGESWYQLAAYLNSRDGRVAKGLGFIHPVMGVQTAMGKRWAGTLAGEGIPGYGVSLVVGARETSSPVASVDGGGALLGLRSRLFDRQAFLAPGTSTSVVTDTLSTEMTATFTVDGGTVRDTDYFSRAVLLGRVDRRMDEDGRGRTWLLGLGTAFRLRKLAPVSSFDGLGVPAGQIDELRLEEPRDFRDKYALVHVVGPVAEGVWRGGTGAVSFLVEAYPDFGLINAYALNDYSETHDISGMKTTMLYYGYYYGWGGSLMARVDGSFGPFSAGLAGEIHRHGSIEGRDRFQDDLTADVHASDAWDLLKASVGMAIPRTPLELEGSAEWSRRKGRIGETVTAASESRYGVELLWRL